MKQHLARLFRGAERIVKIPGEASTRGFFRIHQGKRTRIAMVYPEPAPAELDRIIRLSALYQTYGLMVPAIEARPDDRVLILQDLGDIMVQSALRRANRPGKEKILAEIADILVKLAGIPYTETESCLDLARMTREMNFFLDHFLFLENRPGERGVLQPVLQYLIEKIAGSPIFAHRDFHTRNMLWHDGRIGLIDFQDSLQAPPFYDLVSVAFDSYIDLGREREILWHELRGTVLEPEPRQLRLTALQRNIKALGTFGYQVAVRRRTNYRRYIPRTQRHISAHLAELQDPELKPLASYFLKTNQN